MRADPVEPEFAPLPVELTVRAFDEGENEIGQMQVLVDVRAIPTVSEWGLIVMMLLGLTAGTIMYRQRRPAAA